MIPRAVTRGLRRIEFTILILNENSFKGYEKDLQSVTQVETSVVGVYGERM